MDYAFRGDKYMFMGLRDLRICELKGWELMHFRVGRFIGLRVNASMGLRN